MTTPILQIEGLQVNYRTDAHWIKGIHQIDLIQRQGQNIGIIGESGSGKTTLAMALMGLIEAPHQVNGKILYQGTDLLKLSKSELKALRWKEIAMVFQNALDVLNPVMTIGEQITERLVELMGYSKEEASAEQERLLEMVALEAHWKEAYPHQLSGGMRQRVLIAMAISCKPKLIIFDEPTSSLDVILRQSTIELIKELQAALGFSMMVISHDLSVMTELSEDLLVMYAGSIVETGKTDEVIHEANHPYTRGLISSSVQVFPYKDLWGIAGEAANAMDEGCTFAPRCTQKRESCFIFKPELKSVNPFRKVACHRGGIVHLLEAHNISKTYTIGKKKIEAVQNASFYVRHGETVALVGQSGSGKSTLAHMVSGFIPIDQGGVTFEKLPIEDAQVAQREGGIQLVLQDPFSSISRRLTVADVIEEPLNINGIGSVQERRDRTKEALNAVQLPVHDAFLKRLCSTLSGGQRQRIAIARALVMAPKLLIADEITSMMDVSTQANIMRLLKGLQNAKGFAMLYITHNMHLARKISERIIVLEDGVIVESGATSHIMDNTECCITQELLETGLKLA